MARAADKICARFLVIVFLSAVALRIKKEAVNWKAETNKNLILSV